MVSFVCDVCQETLKKPKLDQHFRRCPNAQFSCIDCSKTFYDDYHLHTSCVTEQQKYEKGCTKTVKKKNVANSLSKTSIVEQIKNDEPEKKPEATQDEILKQKTSDKLTKIAKKNPTLYKLLKKLKKLDQEALESMVFSVKNNIFTIQ